MVTVTEVFARHSPDVSDICLLKDLGSIRCQPKEVMECKHLGVHQ